ncbi:MAG TPA: extracellular solute-binding protein [Trebonia sp.]|nr:extracellular solute-binding protein [Trebonia sp.]
MPHRSALPLRSRRSRRRITLTTLAGLSVAGAALLTACAPGGSSGGGSASGQPTSTAVGNAKVTITVEEASIDGPLFQKLGALFTAKYPNITVKVVGQDFNTLQTNVPRILASSTPPDIIRLGAFGNTIADNQLTNLDPYAASYGWNSWPQAQFESTRSNAAGTERGTGSLYGVGPGFGLTGVYYNKALLTKIGATVPATLADLQADMAKAKTKGIAPMIISGPAQTLAFALQNLLVDYAGSVTTVQNWNYDVPGANINTPAFVKAATTLQTWAKDGYFPSDANSLQEADAVSQFDSGTGLFYVSGNWDAPAIDKAAPGKFGFFGFPPATAGGITDAMSASDLQVIPAKAAHPAQAAAFLNFIQTDQDARQASLDMGGYVPGGAANAASLSTPAGSAVSGTVSFFSQATTKNELTEFMVNATSSISASTLVPETELLVGGKVTPAAFASTVQSDYVSQLASR